MLCKALDVVPSLQLFFFFHFYIMMATNDWVSFFLCHGLIDIYDELSSSIKRWKQDFFFGDAATQFP